MSVSTSFDVLSQVLRRYESNEGAIHRVDATVHGRDGGDELHVSIDVAVPLCPTGDAQTGSEPTPRAASLGVDGELQLEFSQSVAATIAEYAPDSVSSTTDAARVTADGTVLVTITLEFAPDTETEAAEVSTASTAAVNSGSGSSSETEPTMTFADRLHVASLPSEPSTEAATLFDALDRRPTHEDETERSSDPESKAEDEPETPIDTEIERSLEAARNDELPPYEDTEYLQCLYDSLDTFEAMADALEMDIASETVRRYMIDAGVHEPASYETTAGSEEGQQALADESEAADSAADSDETADQPPNPSSSAPDASTDRSVESDAPVDSESDKPLVTDGIGLPDTVTGTELIDAVESSMTLYDVHRQLGLDRRRTRELLGRLNLLDLVVMRLSDTTDPERRPSREEITDRIRESVAPEE
ncbi:prolipoprotein diacylglyceryl transferase [Natrinema versiforme]|uniref:Uncharacterized protein n=1 Tax=Natrinema versiforme JCM 10478 TaxID=1227496 RepID=L9XNG3_9EURY|nr:hypothetical protein [Natrinema versiforme]ELY63290.1 hypothetical protein C489_19531 [Natrinema versiforme JCM 10478]